MSNYFLDFSYPPDGFGLLNEGNRCQSPGSSSESTEDPVIQDGNSSSPHLREASRIEDTNSPSHYKETMVFSKQVTYYDLMNRIINDMNKNETPLGVGSSIQFIADGKKVPEDKYGNLIDTAHTVHVLINGP